MPVTFEGIVEGIMEGILESIGEGNQEVENGGNINVNYVNDLIEPRIIPQMVVDKVPFESRRHSISSELRG